MISQRKFFPILKPPRNYSLNLLISHQIENFRFNIFSAIIDQQVLRAYCEYPLIRNSLRREHIKFPFFVLLCVQIQLRIYFVDSFPVLPIHVYLWKADSRSAKVNFNEEIQRITHLTFHICLKIHVKIGLLARLYFHSLPEIALRYDAFALLGRHITGDFNSVTSQVKQAVGGDKIPFLLNFVILITEVQNTLFLLRHYRQPVLENVIFRALLNLKLFSISLGFCPAGHES